MAPPNREQIADISKGTSVCLKLCANCYCCAFFSVHALIKYGDINNNTVYSSRQ